MRDLVQKVLQWGADRNLIEGSTPERQFSKMMEEVGEIGIAIGKDDIDEIRDAIGDTVVTLILTGAQYDLDLGECLRAAYDVIKDRKGKLINGVFVKDA